MKLRNDVSGYDLFCPFCFQRIAALIGHSTPYAGDYLCCRCGGIGVLRSRSSRTRSWTVTKPTLSERKRIADDRSVQAILREFGA